MAGRPVWLGTDTRVWDHMRVHIKVMEDWRLGAHEHSLLLALVRHGETSTGRSEGVSEAELTSYLGGARLDLSDPKRPLPLHPIPVSRNTVRGASRVLEVCGYIEVERTAGQPNRYKLLDATRIVVPPPTWSVSDQVVDGSDDDSEAANGLPEPADDESSEGADPRASEPGTWSSTDQPVDNSAEGAADLVTERPGGPLPAVARAPGARDLVSERARPGHQARGSGPDALLTPHATELELTADAPAGPRDRSIGPAVPGLTTQQASALRIAAGALGRTAAATDDASLADVAQSVRLMTRKPAFADPPTPPTFLAELISLAESTFTRTQVALRDRQETRT